jgi:peptidoglycan/LPS O-acetylase OafA/YrhL
MADPVEIDPKVRWEIHDEQVRERRKSARRWFLTGLALFIGSVLIGGLIAVGGGSAFFVEMLSLVWGVGVMGLIVGMVKSVRAGRLSADVIREVEARRKARTK